MNANNKLLIAIVIIYCVRWSIHVYLQDVIKQIQSNFLFKSKKFSKFDEIYTLIFTKMYNEKDNIFISKLKVRLNTYISNRKYNNKSSMDSIVTVIISAQITISIASYTMLSQANKNLIESIVQNLNNSFTAIILILMIVYGVKEIIEQFTGSKFEYYLMVKNIIDEVEKNKPI